VAEHGATVHFVTAELDHGPMVLQAAVPVLPGDTEDTLAARAGRGTHSLSARGAPVRRRQAASQTAKSVASPRPPVFKPRNFMRLPPAILGNTEEVLREILRFTAPADVTLSRYFKDHPRLGGASAAPSPSASTRSCATNLLHRLRRSTGASATMRRLTLLGMAEAVGAESLGGLTEEETAFLERIAAIDRKLMPPQMRSNLPKWLFDKFVAQYGEAETLLLADVLNTPAPLDLRVNTIKATATKWWPKLAEAPIAAEPTPYAPLACAC
jgi:hypothetical protein